jgi:hypothetical protein
MDSDNGFGQPSNMFDALQSNVNSGTDFYFYTKYNLGSALSQLTLCSCSWAAFGSLAAGDFLLTLGDVMQVVTGDGLV